MKRVLTAAVFGGLLMVLPQAPPAGALTPSDHGPGQSAEESAGQPQERPEQEPPRSAPPSDRGRDSDEDETILF